MLSYRHSFHAGNHADVLKHIIFIETIRYFQQKPKPFTLVDTHAGTGLYHLHSQSAQKLQEHTLGFEKLIGCDHELLQPYLQCIAAFNASSTGDSINYYPGSPSIACHLLRTEDQAHFLSSILKTLKHSTKTPKARGLNAGKKMATKASTASCHLFIGVPLC